jgi:hypothetical protein
MFLTAISSSHYLLAKRMLIENNPIYIAHTLKNVGPKFQSVGEKNL